MAEVGGSESTVDPLISFDSLKDISFPQQENGSHNSATESKQGSTSKTQSSSQKDKLPDGTGKLCGWLNITTRAIIKPNRLRWFVYGDTTCKLYYYRNPHDFIPLGEIDIAHATFYFDAASKPGCFEIRYKFVNF